MVLRFADIDAFVGLSSTINSNKALNWSWDKAWAPRVCKVL